MKKHFGNLVFLVLAMAGLTACPGNDNKQAAQALPPQGAGLYPACLPGAPGCTPFNSTTGYIRYVGTLTQWDSNKAGYIVKNAGGCLIRALCGSTNSGYIIITMYPGAPAQIDINVGGGQSGWIQRSGIDIIGQGVPMQSGNSTGTTYVFNYYGWEFDVISQGVPLDGSLQSVPVEVRFKNWSDPAPLHLASGTLVRSL